MTPDPNFGFEQVAIELIRGVVDIVAACPGMAEDQRFIKQQTVVHGVMGFQPRDPVEVMLAGQCVIYDNILRDAARDLLHGQDEPLKARARTGTLASGKLFLSTFAVLRRMQGWTASTAGSRAGAAQTQTAGVAAGAAGPLAGTPGVAIPPACATPAVAETQRSAARSTVGGAAGNASTPPAVETPMGRTPETRRSAARSTVAGVPPVASTPSAAATPAGSTSTVAEMRPSAVSSPIVSAPALAAGPRATVAQQLTAMPPAASTRPPAPGPSAAKPRFVCQRVHPPRGAEAGTAPGLGAAFGLAEPTRRASFRAGLLGDWPLIAGPDLRQTLVKARISAVPARGMAAS